jgi:hypothetical protein
MFWTSSPILFIDGSFNDALVGATAANSNSSRSARTFFSGGKTLVAGLEDAFVAGLEDAFVAGLEDAFARDALTELITLSAHSNAFFTLSSNTFAFVFIFV